MMKSTRRERSAQLVNAGRNFIKHFGAHEITEFVGCIGCLTHEFTK
jgi:hypothetical protein